MVREHRTCAAIRVADRGRTVAADAIKSTVADVTDLSLAPAPDPTDPGPTGPNGELAVPAPTSLGVVYLPKSGTSVGTFQFLVDRSAGDRVEIGTAIAADTREGVIIGAVVDMATVGHLADPFAADLLGGGDPALDNRQEAVVATAQVFHSPHLRPVRAGTVRPATRAEMEVATGADRLDWKIPAGVVELLSPDGTGTVFSPVSLDGHALLGPESQGMIIGGLSGQASKTSFAGVVMRAAIAAGNADKDSISGLFFNVKGTDLLGLDLPPADGYELTEEDLAIYGALGIPATPFPDVTVYAPSLPGVDVSRSPREDAELIRWDLRTLWRYLAYFWPWMYEDDKVSGFVAQFEELCLNNPNPHQRIDSFAKLEEFFRSEIENAEEQGLTDCWNGRIHIATMRKLRRMFSALPAKMGGLLTRDALPNGPLDVPVEHWRHGQVIVVDIAGLTPDVQGIVVARTLERLLKAAEEGDLGVDHLMVFMDELNAYAPAQGGEVRNIRKLLERVASQGRYAGLSLIGAAQKVSKISEMVRDNASTMALGRTAPGELDAGPYGRLPAGLVERILTLPKGRMVLWHYTLRSALVVRFPRPAWQTGKAKTTGNVDRGHKTRRNALDTIEMSDRSKQLLTKGLTETQVEEIVAGADDPAVAFEALKSARVVDVNDVVLDHEAVEFDPDDPFAFGD